MSTLEIEYEYEPTSSSRFRINSYYVFEMINF